MVPEDASADEREAMWSTIDEPPASPERLAMLRALCSSCPVLMQCRALGAEMSDGFFGGLTTVERRTRKRGDLRSHELLVAEGRWPVLAQRTGVHGGDRRSSSWQAPSSATAGSIAFDGSASDAREGAAVVAAPGVARGARRRSLVLMRDGSGVRWRAAAERFGSLGDGPASPAVCWATVWVPRIAA